MVGGSSLWASQLADPELSSNVGEDETSNLGLHVATYIVFILHFLLIWKFDLYKFICVREPAGSQI